MDIRNTKELKAFAGERLGNAREEKKIVLIYAGITIILSALVTLINYCLGLQIDRSGGLSNLGTRSLLSTVQTILPMAQALFLMCLDVGYLAAMLRVARGQYTSPQTLRLGFDRFWPLLRLSLLQGLIYFAICFVSVYIALMLFLITPLGKPFLDILLPLITESSLSGEAAMVLDDATYVLLESSMTPALVICGILFCVLSAPIFYQYRMANYVIIDRPAVGAIAAMRESRKMMKGSRFHLFRLDLSLWWYYAAMLVAVAVCYADIWLPMLGVTLPWSADVGYFLFYGLYLAAEFGIYYFIRNRAEVTYALAYDSLRPEEKNDGGVVLGNIFNM